MPLDTKDWELCFFRFVPEIPKLRKRKLLGQFGALKTSWSRLPKALKDDCFAIFNSIFQLKIAK